MSQTANSKTQMRAEDLTLKQLLGGILDARLTLSHDRIKAFAEPVIRVYPPLGPYFAFDWAEWKMLVLQKIREVTDGYQS